MIIQLFTLAAVAVCCSGEVWMAPSTMRPEEIEMILEIHNDVRASIGASNVMKIRWNPKLAELAEGHVRHCAVRHANVELPDGTRVGQNLGASSTSNYDMIEEGFGGWISEIKSYDPETLTCRGGWRPCGHLTQVVSAHTEWIGCAVNHDCPGPWKTLFICNYYPGNEIKKPFTYGHACSACPAAKCENGLCACDNPFCGKRGVLDLNTCACKCDKPFSGAACDKKTCPPADKKYCGTQWPKSYCSTFANVPEECPYMCGVC